MLNTWHLYFRLPTYPERPFPVQIDADCDVIVNFVKSFFGYITGGLSIVTTVACMFFGAISGSAVATTSAIGSFMIPEMEKDGYPKDFAATLSAAAGSVGVIIPPSVPSVIYAVAVNSPLEIYLLPACYLAS